jgi:hypothetical protein
LVGIERPRRLEIENDDADRPARSEQRQDRPLVRRKQIVGGEIANLEPLSARDSMTMSSWPRTAWATRLLAAGKCTGDMRCGPAYDSATTQRASFSSASNTAPASAANQWKAPSTRRVTSRFAFRRNSAVVSS